MTDHSLAALCSDLTDAAWLRPLAFRLAGPDDADDALQEAWLAHGRRASDPRAPRAWFATVLANFGRKRRRDAARRAQRESERARQAEATAAPATDELVARMELQQRVANAVLALPEPYRSTVLLHFVEGLSAREIAARNGEAWVTVRSRLSRGVEQLRAALARDRADWRDALALAVFGVPGRRLARPPLGAATAVAALVAVSLAAVALAWLALGHGSAPATAPAVAQQRAAVDAPRPPADEGNRSAAAPPAPAPPATDATPALVTFRGELLDPSGAPLADVGVLVGGERRAITDSHGGFAVDLPPGAHEIDTDDAHCMLWAAPLRADGPNRFLAARRFVLLADVVDDAGRPIAGARLHLRVGTPVDYPFPLFDLSPRTADTTSSAPDGHCRLLLPWFPGSSVSASADGHAEGASIDIGGGDDDDAGIAVAVLDDASGQRLGTTPERIAAFRAEVPARFVLRPQPRTADPAWRTWVIEGLVLDEKGRPVAGAEVSFPAAWPVTSRDDGTFRIETGSSNLLDGKLVARHPELGIAAVADPQARWGHDPTKNPHEELCLRRADHAVRGRVVDLAGNALAGRSVRLADPIAFTSGGALHLAEDAAFRVGAMTRADGSFELGGLLPRPQRLAVLDPATLQWFEAGTFAVDADDIAIAVPAPSGLQPEWRGVLVDAQGRPIAGSVTARLWVPLGGSGSAVAHQVTVQAGDDGAVALPAQCAAAQVLFEATGRMRTVRARDALDATFVPLGRIAHFRYRGGSAPPSVNQRRIEVLDAQDHPLVVEGPYDGSIWSGWAYWLTGTKSAVLATSELATTLVVHTDDGGEHRDEPHRFPLHLEPGVVTTVD